MTKRGGEHGQESTKATKKPAIHDEWRVDYGEWVKKDTWTVYEAIALLVSDFLPPEKADAERERGLSRFRYSSKDTESIRNAVVAALEMGEVAPFGFYPKDASPRDEGIIRVEPRGFVQWAAARGFNVPKGLRERMEVVAVPPGPQSQTSAANQARKNKAARRHAEIIDAAKKLSQDPDCSIQGKIRDRSGKLVAARVADELHDKSHGFFRSENTPLVVDGMARVISKAINRGELK